MKREFPKLRHGMSKEKIHYTWKNMKARCFNKARPGYKNYGGRGITVCDRWLVFENFLADMGECPEGRSLDRINNDGNYEPSNCRWATRLEQSHNSSRPRLLTHNGITKNITEWADHLGISIATLLERLERWTLEDALTTPKTHRHKHKFTPQSATSKT